jgi:NFU1 iron-sulfur cluster scaffold homolog, mitochondrial
MSDILHPALPTHEALAARADVAKNPPHARCETHTLGNQPAQGKLGSTSALHVERTGDPEILRWVGHHPQMLDATPGLRVPTPNDTSPLAQLMHRGSITEVFANQGDLLIRRGVNEQWNVLAVVLREAIAQEFTALPLWLCVPAVGRTASLPDLVLVQEVVTEAAGALAQSHGGSIEVVSIAPTTITVQMHGACNGCSGTDATLSGLVLQAIRNRWPQFDTVVVEESAKISALSIRWSKINFSKR